MPELRWILLVLGILFCIGLWWRETRRPRQAAGSSARAGEPLRAEPTVAAHDTSRRTQMDTSPLEPPSFEPASPEPFSIETQPEPAAPGPALVAQERLARELFSKPVAEAFERIEPILGDTEIVEAEPPPSEPRPPPPPEKLVTVRLTAPPLERFEGRELVEALRAAGLEYGKFSIFHRSTADGATLFSVASLVEPGTFELDRIEGRRFPGVSLFAILPGPADPGATIEELITTARQLAERLQGSLQDERGVPLTPQRLADLRAGVADWQRRAEAAGTSQK